MCCNVCSILVILHFCYSFKKFGFEQKPVSRLNWGKLGRLDHERRQMDNLKSKSWNGIGILSPIEICKHFAGLIANANWSRICSRPRLSTSIRQYWPFDKVELDRKVIRPPKTSNWLKLKSNCMLSNEELKKTTNRTTDGNQLLYGVGEGSQGWRKKASGSEEDNY